jgi:hypothetical protein
MWYVHTHGTRTCADTMRKYAWWISCSWLYLCLVHFLFLVWGEYTSGQSWTLTLLVLHVWSSGEDFSPKACQASHGLARIHLYPIYGVLPGLCVARACADPSLPQTWRAVTQCFLLRVARACADPSLSHTRRGQVLSHFLLTNRIARPRIRPSKGKEYKSRAQLSLICISVSRITRLIHNDFPFFLYLLQRCFYVPRQHVHCCFRRFLCRKDQFLCNKVCVLAQIFTFILLFSHYFPIFILCLFFIIVANIFLQIGRQGRLILVGCQWGEAVRCPLRRARSERSARHVRELYSHDERFVLLLAGFCSLIFESNIFIIYSILYSHWL